MSDSKVGGNYVIVLPESFPDYISKLNALIDYADLVIKNPLNANRSDRLWEFANLKYELTVNICDIERYLDTNHWKYVKDLIRIRDKLDGKLFMLEGRVIESGGNSFKR